MQDKKLLLLIGLGLLAIGSLIYGIVTPSKTRQELSSQSSSSSSTVTTVAPAPFPKERNTKRSSFLSWGRNPFLLQERGAGSQLVLNGIAWDERSPRAVINGQIVAVGDKIEGKTVVAIRSYGVTLKDAAESLELRLSRK